MRLFSTILSIGAFAVLFLINGCSDKEASIDVGTKKVFDGNSDKLQQTMIVPTLDTPMEDGKNIIWCSSFQLAWNELKDDIVKDSLQLNESNANVVAQRLNQAKQSLNDLDSSDFYAKAGYVKDQVVETIIKEMAAKFPNYDTSHLKAEDGEVIWVYGYLNARAKFDIPFVKERLGISFKDIDGKMIQVQSFGLFHSGLEERENLAKQIDVLYFKETKDKYGLEEFIIDPCKTTQPYQVILACVGHGKTLEETIADVETKIREFKPADIPERERGFMVGDQLSVPVTCWKIGHDFEELLGKHLKNKGLKHLFISRSMQDISFRLDRSGAVVVSEGGVAMVCQPREFIFNRPFLIYLKKRDGGEPFFAMWVDNAELLNKFEPSAADED
ncbi:MAG: hypothetical protein JEZ07_09950 [Phycisphaerae bacterium]|nr:hypothetical protein [Phycisphaerae bacterium]